MGSLANYTSLTLLVGVGTAAYVYHVYNRQQRRDQRKIERALVLNKLYESDYPVTDIKEVAANGDLQPDQCVLVGTVPGPFQTTRYIYKLVDTGQLFTASSPFSVMNRATKH